MPVMPEMEEAMKRRWVSDCFAALLPLAAVPAFCACGAVPDSPLTIAAARGDDAEIERLLASGAGPCAADGSGWAPLHWAARNGRLAAIRILVIGGAGVNDPDVGANGWTPLMHAAHLRRAEAVELLLALGADPDARPRGDGATALIMAAGYGDLRSVRALLGAGADPRLEGPGRVNALWAAAGGGALSDITDGPPLGTCFPQVVSELRQAAPDLKLAPGAATAALGWLARTGECSSLLSSLPRRAD
ncbi:MAG TPA: ankyrin repeat domain-containing protein [Candidatus Polarisedimenticolia bacterium]|nr:ankyrin repeat domain-containing protein [Candidatus Polarisedimenticolia bacterium]